MFNRILDVSARPLTSPTLLHHVLAVLGLEILQPLINITKTFLFLFTGKGEGVLGDSN